ncbi:hypothetical protein [Streptomyces sp. AP-93]|uniref:hypothetical protein n=1 Tax=Streptomyces sp. AP-93 TaxID=2929048 RepID=UPI001FB01B99|nr:hypothetical protein [Streptomyces sp. AP-93]MCJ0869767.1 hypothetical protein [Streptomyces sp. AP-93]
MDGPELSRQELMILKDMEQDLCADRLLDRRLRTLRRGVRPWTSPGSWSRRHRAGLYTGVLGVACAILLVYAVATSSPPLIWAFAAVWVFTLIRLIRLAIGWCRTHDIGP